MAFKSILDPTFKYRNALSTDVRKTFERIRREQRLKQQPEDAKEQLPRAKVVAAIGSGQGLRAAQRGRKRVARMGSPTTRARTAP